MFVSPAAHPRTETCAFGVQNVEGARCNFLASLLPLQLNSSIVPSKLAQRKVVELQPMMLNVNSTSTAEPIAPGLMSSLHASHSHSQAATRDVINLHHSCLSTHAEPPQRYLFSTPSLIPLLSSIASSHIPLMFWSHHLRIHLPPPDWSRE